MKETVATMQTFKLEELAQAAGVSPRTVRYYVQRGLLPAPQFRGRDTAYDEDHLIRLKAIRRLQERFLPLDAIQAELARLGAKELEALAGGQEPPPRPRPHPIPAPPPYRTPPRVRAEGWRRWELAPGVELHVSDRAGVTIDDDAWLEELKRMIAEKGRNP
jgi:DNA-binding transcriptional MerR regulator